MTRQKEASAKRAKWRENKAEWEASGQTPAVFCLEKRPVDSPVPVLAEKMEG